MAHHASELPALALRPPMLKISFPRWRVFRSVSLFGLAAHSCEWANMRWPGWLLN